MQGFIFFGKIQEWNTIRGSTKREGESIASLVYLICGLGWSGQGILRRFQICLVECLRRLVLEVDYE